LDDNLLSFERKLAWLLRVYKVGGKERSMNLLLKTISVAALSFLVGQMGGCASSSNLVDKWHDPGYQAPPLSKMLVIAVRKDAAKRRIWEDAFSGEFAKHGVEATSSYSLFPDAPPDTNQVIATVLANGFDGILVVLKLPAEKNTQYKKGYISVKPDMLYGSYYVPFPYLQRYWNSYFIVEHPGYVDTQAVAIRTIDVTTTGNNGRLIWSATSRTPDPGSVTDVQRGIAGLVMSELAERNIIGSKK
jgi:hypothetical protein